MLRLFNSKTIVYVFGWIVAAVFLCIYIRYGLHAWFWWDDLVFLDLYKDSFRWSELWSFNNFGRFVSRNIYWHVLISVFGLRSEPFFMVNVFLSVVNSMLVWLLVSNLISEKVFPFMCAVVYFIMYPTQVCVSWLAYEQHLVGHFFAVLFLLVFISWTFNETKISYRHIALLWAVYALGLFSNVLVISLLPAVLTILLLWPRPGKWQPLALLVLMMVLTSVVFLFRLNHYLDTDAVYASEISVAQLVKALKDYTLGRSGGLTMIIRAAAWAIFCIITAFFVKTRDRKGMLLVVLAFCFFVPPLFLAKLRQPHYGALTALFLSIVFAYVIYRLKLRTVWLLAMVLAHLYLANFAGITGQLYRQQSAGLVARAFVQEVNDFTPPGIQQVYVKAVQPVPGMGPACQALEDLWFHLGHGAAFRLFGRVEAGYIPCGRDAEPPGDSLALLIDADLHVKGVLAKRLPWR